jgi:hypothetical protein
MADRPQSVYAAWPLPASRTWHLAPTRRWAELKNRAPVSLSLLSLLLSFSISLARSLSLYLPHPAVACIAPMATVLSHWRPSPPKLRAARASPSFALSSMPLSQGHRAALWCRWRSSYHRAVGSHGRAISSHLGPSQGHHRVRTGPYLLPRHSSPSIAASPAEFGEVQRLLSLNHDQGLRARIREKGRT